MAKADPGSRNHLMFIKNDGWKRIPAHIQDPVAYAQSKNAVTVKRRHSATNETIIWTAKMGMLV